MVMQMRRYLTQINFRILLLFISLCLSAWTLGSWGALAQRGSALDDRLNRQLDQVERQQQGMRVDAERRFGTLQADIKVLQSEINAVTADISAIKNLGIGLISAVGLLILQSLWGLISATKDRRRDSQDRH